jgi:hypothetical protein
MDIQNSVLYKDYSSALLQKLRLGLIIYMIDELTVKNQETLNFQYTEDEVWLHFGRLSINAGAISVNAYFSTPLGKQLFIAYFDSVYGSLKHNGIYTGLRLLPSELPSENTDQEDNQTDDPMAS